MTSITGPVESFRDTDSGYFAIQEAARSLDPLALRADGLISSFQGLQHATDPMATREVVDRLSKWRETAAEKPMSELLAARRDYDKTQSAYLAKGHSMLEIFPECIDHVRFFRDTTGSPRADFYSYSIGNMSELSGTYTGDEREVRLITIFTEAITAAHAGIHSVMQARAAIRKTDTPNARNHLELSLANIHDMHVPLLRTYREVGPAFVAHELGKFTTGLSFEGQAYEGPNPSHSGFLTLDRFVLGSLDGLKSRPFMEKQIEYRMSDMPSYLTQSMHGADAEKTDESLLQLAKAHTPELIDMAAEVITQIRKFKVAHKSYADKASATKGKFISNDSGFPDLLSEAITYTRSKEENHEW